MDNIGVNVQPQTVILASGEWPTIERDYPAGILAIIDWPAAVESIPLGVKIGMWRFTQDPRATAGDLVTGWPDAFIRRCPWAVFANEPDIEVWPAWYYDVCGSWHRAGGKLVEPAWHAEAARDTSLDGHDAVSWHCYDSDFRNRDAVLARANGRPVFGTEYGDAFHQYDVLNQLTQAGVTETVFLFAWRWQGNSAAGYDLAGVTMEQPTEPAATVVPMIYERQWRALNPAVALNPDAAIFKDWLRWRETGTTRMGIPCSGEQPYPDGGDGAVCQMFTGAVAIWTPANGVEWR